ncbi:hypothetical protein CROQUDRAFT_17701, partial [Cronartium quercuum f. sp. fusiforme G11]
VAQQLGEKAEDSLVVFTDGSYLQGIGGGAAAATSNKTNLAIFSDSQKAIRATHFPIQPKSGQSLVKFVKNQIRKLPEGTTLELFWTPGHEGIPLNEVADKAAKQAAKVENGSTQLPMSLANLLQESWKMLSIPSSEFLSHNPLFKTPAKKMADALNNLEKGQAAAIFQLQTGHCLLNAYLYRFKKSPTKLCRGCGVPETVAHFILYCTRYQTQRRKFRAKVKAEKLRINFNKVDSILDDPSVLPFLAQFVLETGRFDHLCSY